MDKNSSTMAAVWSFLERLSSQIVSFVIGIILARLLSPHDYGIVGLTSIFIILSNVFIDAGFGNGLIRKKDRDENDLSTAFIFNIIVAIFIYGLLWVLSPFIANYFNEPILIPLVKVVGINVIFNSLCIVQTAILTAQLNIRIQTVINLSAQVPAGVFAIFLAYHGFGVYALALQTVSSSAIKTIFLWYFAKWIPKGSISRSSFRYLWRFGSKLLFANLIGGIFNQIYSVLIGKYIGKDELGYYSKSSHLNNNVDGVTSGIVQKVALPVLSKYQDNQHELTQKFRDTMLILLMFIAPLSGFFCFSSDDIITFLWTDKWIQSSILFQFLIVGTMFNPVGQLSLSLMQAVGRTGLILKLEFPKKAIYCVYIAIGFCYGIIGLVVAQIFINLTAALINMWATKKILSYSYVSQCIDIAKYILIAFPIYAIVCYLLHTHYLLLNIGLNFVVSSTIYCVVLYLSKDRLFMYVLSMLKSTLLNK